MGELIPLFGMLTGIAIVGFGVLGVVRLVHSPVGVALARRIQGRAGSDDEELRAEVSWLRDQVEEVHRQLGEAQERLDFAERLLSQRAQAGPLPGA